MDADVIDAAMAHDLHSEACRDYDMVEWVVRWEVDSGVGMYDAQLHVRGRPWPYSLMGETLSEIHRQLPPGLVREPRHWSDPADVVEKWFQP